LAREKTEHQRCDIIHGVKSAAAKKQLESKLVNPEVRSLIKSSSYELKTITDIASDQIDKLIKQANRISRLVRDGDNVDFEQEMRDAMYLKGDIVKKACQFISGYLKGDSIKFASDSGSSDQ